MSTQAHDDEPITGRITKAVETKMANMERRSYDRAWAIFQPVAAYILTGLIAGVGSLIVGVVILWMNQSMQGQEISRLRQEMEKLETKEIATGARTEETRREIADLKARRDEFNRWRDATDAEQTKIRESIERESRQDKQKGR
jgi:septal ring factor EnvC (AmiA/AmiB activator)